MSTFTRSVLAALLGLMSLSYCYGTHIMGGELTYKQTGNSPYQYTFTLTIYRDAGGVDQPAATLDFGIGGITQTSSASYRIAATQFSNDIETIGYQFVYTYPGPGNYTVSFTEENRYAEIVNIQNAVNTPFHIEATFTISPTLGLNNSVVLLNPPIYLATVGEKMCISPAPFDPEGDSLSYRLVVPAGAIGYVFPDQVTPLGIPESGSGNPTFTIHSVTGEICWDAPGPRKRNGGVLATPGDYGDYSVAFVVDEWRNGTKISSVTRDFIIRVVPPVPSDPELSIENAQAVGFTSSRQIRTDPGQPLTFNVLYKNATGIRDTLLAVSETLSPRGNAAVTVIDSANFIKAKYTWTPTETNRRNHPYLLVFRGGAAFSNGQQLSSDLTVAVFVGADTMAGTVTATEDDIIRQRIKVFPNPTRSKIRFSKLPGIEAILE